MNRSAAADVTRPPGTGTGPAVAKVHLIGGTGCQVRASGKTIPAAAGLPLLASDELLVPIGEFLLVALGLGFVIPATGLIDLYAYFSAGEIVKSIPGPPQGLGTMELAYRWFFGDWASASQIVSAALAIRLVGLVCALPGAWLAATSRVSRRGTSAGRGR